MVNPLIVKPLIILGIEVLSGKELELKDVALTTLGSLNPFSELTDSTLISLDKMNTLNQLNINDIGVLEKFCETAKITLMETEKLRTGIKDGIEVLSYDKAKNSGWVLVGIKCKGQKLPFLSGIKPGQLGANIEYRYEVRGNFYNKIGSFITIQRKDGSLINLPIVRKKEIMHGMVVWYNVPDFDSFSLATIDIPEHIIQLDASEHKRYAIREVTRMFHDGDIAKGVFSTDIEAKLGEIHATGKVPTCLYGYEIHHDGKGRMQFIPNDIHCRRSAHLSGSWLMNHKNYGLYVLNNASEVTAFDAGSLKLSVELLKDQRMTTLFESFTQNDIKKYIAGSLNERKNVVLTLSEKIKETVNIKDISIVFKSMHGHTYGLYDIKSRQILMSENLLATECDYENVVNTMLHEIRHAIQHDAICNPAKYDFSTEIIVKWQYELENYISPKIDLEAYAKQSIEVDAREWADYYTSLLNA